MKMPVEWAFVLEGPIEIGLLKMLVGWASIFLGAKGNWALVSGNV